MSNLPVSVPLCYALAQVHFNPVPSIGEYIPAVQDVLRREGWPEFQHQKSHGFEVKPIDGGEPEVSSRERERWLFSDVEATQGFIFQEKSIIFHTTDYQGFESVLASVLRGLEVLHDVATLQFVDRVGLRYFNVIDPDSMGQGRLAYWVPERLLGLANATETGLRHSFSETVFEERGGTLVSRSLVSPRGVVWPPDLQPVVLEPLSQFRIHGRTVVLLDNDFYKVFPKPHIPCDGDRVGKELQLCHEMIGRMFREMTTADARAAWGVYE